MVISQLSKTDKPFVVWIMLIEVLDDTEMWKGNISTSKDMRFERNLHIYG